MNTGVLIGPVTYTRLEHPFKVKYGNLSVEVRPVENKDEDEQPCLPQYHSVESVEFTETL